MSVNRNDMGPVLFETDDDDLPDFSRDEWAVKIDAALVKRGRPWAGDVKYGLAKPARLFEL